MNYPTNNMAATAAQLPDRQPEVSSEMDRLRIQCERLDGGLEELEKRLMTVLAQRAENGIGEVGQPEPVRVPLAQAIHDRGNHLILLNDRLQSIINRIEV
jgi:hypothetical protein